jgi:arginine exporter protein ArgO
MNKEMIASLLRQVIFIVAGYMGLGSFFENNPDLVTAGISFIVIVATSVWATWTRTDKQIVASAAEKVPVPATAQKEVGITEPVKPKV